MAEMTRADWIRAGSKLAEVLKEFETTVEHLGIGPVHMTAHGCKNGLRAAVTFVDDKSWYEVTLVDGAIHLLVDGDDFYIKT